MSKELAKTYDPKAIEEKLSRGSGPQQKTVYNGDAASEYHRKASHGPRP